MALKFTKVSNAAADNVRYMKGKYVTSADGDGDYVCFEVPRKCLVHKVIADIKTAFTGSSTGTLTIGVKKPGAAIVVDALGTDAETLSEATGVKVINKAIYLEDGGVVTLGVTKGDSAADLVARLFIGYTVIH